MWIPNMPNMQYAMSSILVVSRRDNQDILSAIDASWHTGLRTSDQFSWVAVAVFGSELRYLIPMPVASAMSRTRVDLVPIRDQSAA
jgi:hypothetical protein